MPNWTQNHVAFEGSKEKIIELKELFSSDEKVFDFNKILPMPEDSEDFQATGSFSMDTNQGDLSTEEFIEKKVETPANWYYWSIKNWGTKWNAVDSNLDVDNEDRIEYSFRTAWDAPRGVIEALWHSGLLEGCTDISWECSHEFEEDVETIIGKKKVEQES